VFGLKPISNLTVQELVQSGNDSRNPYASRSSRDPRSLTSRNVVDSRSKVPGSLWVLRIVVTPRRKGSRSNLALRMTSALNIDFVDRGK